MADNTEAGSVSLGIDLNGSSISSQVAQLVPSLTKVGKKLGGALAASLSVKALTSFAKECISLGSDLSEVQNVVDTSFKSMSNYVDNFAKDAMKDFGMSETVAKKYMGTIGAMNNAFGIAEKTSYDMATAITGLAGDVASFHNLSSDEAFTKLKSIWTGETESLKELGVVMTQTALDEYALNNGFGKTTAKMTEQEKVMLRFQYVTNALSDASGDFIKTQDSWANQTRVLSLQFDSLKATLGQGFINLFTPIIKMINNLLVKLSALAEGFKTFTEEVMGISSSGVSSGLSNISKEALNVAGDIQGITNASKEAVRELAGFDKVNKIGSDTSSGSVAGTTGISGGSSAMPDISGVEKGTGKVSLLTQALEEAKSQLSSFSAWVGVNFGPILFDVFSDLKKNLRNLAKTFKGVFKDIKSLGGPLLKYFSGPFTKQLQTSFRVIGSILNDTLGVFNRVFSDIWNKAAFPVIQKFVTVGLPTFTEFTTSLTNTFGILVGHILLIFEQLWTDVSPILSLISGIWCDLMNTISSSWNEWGTPVFDGINEAISSTEKIFTTAWESTLKPIWDNIMSVMDEAWREHIKPLTANFLDFVGVLITGASDIYRECLEPIISYLVDIFGPYFSNTLNMISRVALTIFGAIQDSINGMLTTCKGLINFITGVFTSDWDRAWNGVKDIFKGIFDSFESIAKTPLNLVIDLINGMVGAVCAGINAIIKSINKLNIDIPGWVPKYGGEKLGFGYNRSS